MPGPSGDAAVDLVGGGDLARREARSDQADEVQGDAVGVVHLQPSRLDEPPQPVGDGGANSPR